MKERVVRNEFRKRPKRRWRFANYSSNAAGMWRIYKKNWAPLKVFQIVGHKSKKPLFWLLFVTIAWPRQIAGTLETWWLLLEREPPDYAHPSTDCLHHSKQSEDDAWKKINKHRKQEFNFCRLCNHHCPCPFNSLFFLLFPHIEECNTQTYAHRHRHTQMHTQNTHANRLAQRSPSVLFCPTFLAEC